MKNTSFLYILLFVLLFSAGACTATDGPVHIRIEQVTGTATPTPPSLSDNEVLVNLSANFYTGPGSFYEETGTTFPGQTWTVTGRDETGEWYQITDGRWLIAFAVSGRPDVPTVTDIEGRIIAQVVDVLDGDTIAVQFDGASHEVRYLIANTPQVEQAFGQDAYEANLELADGQTVLLEQDVTDRDAYGRLLRYVYLEDETMLNEVLLRRGAAQVAVFPPDVRYEERLRRAQAEARLANRGIWAQDVVPFQETAAECRYVVQPGESLYVIARRFGISQDAVAVANDIEDVNIVRGDSELIIPGCGRAPASSASSS